MHEGFSNPAFHLAIAVAVGMAAQSLARHLKIPVSGGVLVRWLGVRRPSNTGVAFLGANPLALAVAEVYRGAGVDVMVLDSRRPTTPAGARESPAQG